MSRESYAAFTSVALMQLDRFRMATLDATGACEGRGSAVRGCICTWTETYHANGPLDDARDLAGFGDRIQDFKCGAEVTQQPDSVVGFTLGQGQQRLSNFSFASRRLTGDALFAGLYGTHGMGP